MLRSALEQNAEQRKITASAVVAARRIRRRGLPAVAESIQIHQAESIALAFASTVAHLAEQDVGAPPVGSASLTSLLTPAAASTALLDRTETDAKFAALVQSLVVQSSLTASVVDMIRRPAITKYVRTLTPPSCARCAVLAGKVFSWKADFDRHPACDCTALLTTDSRATDLVTDPMQAFRSGQIHGMSRGDIEAIKNGADLGRVVNVRKRQAGLRSGSSVIVRVESLGRLRGGGRIVSDQLTPEGIRRIASDRDEAIRLLERNGYLRGSINTNKSRIER